MPERVMTNADLERMVETSDEWITSRTGIRERRIAGASETTSDMALEAARRAMSSAGVTAADIDMIIVATITPDMPFPSTACLVQQKLGAHRAVAFDIQAACSGFVYALVIGARRVEDGAHETGLPMGAEKMSSVGGWTDPTTCVLLGDCFGAAILKPAPGARGGRGKAAR